MDRRKRLLITLGVLIATDLSALPSAAVQAAEQTCSTNDYELGICNDGSSVTLSVSSTTGQAPEDGAQHGSTAAAAADDWIRCVDAAPTNTHLFRGSCTGIVDGTGGLGGVPGQPAAGTPGGAVTVADVARFLPADARLRAEPDGWAVVAVPANFWVEVQPVTVQAPLLGRPAEVRFTPVAYRWSYGDGTARTTATPGAAWAALGQEQLTATATSHDYTARGSVAVRVGVVYTAEYRIGGGAFIPVVGAVVGDAPPVPTLVVAEHTVLTNGADGG